MSSLLDNPVFNALSTGDAHHALGSSRVKYFDKEISPFAGFEETNEKGFEELHELLPVDRNILYANRKEIETPPGWKEVVYIPGTQFIFHSKKLLPEHSDHILPLENTHAAEMVALAKLTKPGPFDMRTIEFGSYHGIFDNNKLVAMTGQRLHVGDFTEISAVCTHPDYLGRGYAAALLVQQLNIILGDSKTPFLHVRSDNARAIALYERLGFTANGNMNFYFLRRI